MSERSFVFPAVIFFAALFMRVLFLPFPLFSNAPFTSVQANTVATDGYALIAENILAGRGESMSPAPPYAPDSVRTPLYPWLIVGMVRLFHDYKPIFYLQIILGSISAVLAFLIAEFYLPRRWAAGVGFLIALEPLNAFLSDYLMTETLFTFLFLSSLWLFLCYSKKPHAWLAAVSALVLGIATMVKPSGQYLALGFVVLIWLALGKVFSKKFFAHAALFVVIFSAVLAPWLWRNYVVFDNASLVVQPVSNLFAYLVPSTIALEQHISFEQASDQFFAEQHVSGIDAVTLGNAGHFEHIALVALEQHPLGLLESIGVTSYAFFLNDDYTLLVQHLSSQAPPARPATFAALAALVESPYVLVVVGRVFWFIITVLMLIGMVRFAKRQGITFEWLLAVGLIAYFALTTIIIGLAVNGRFRLPIDTFIFIFALYAIFNFCKTVPES